MKHIALAAALALLASCAGDKKSETTGPVHKSFSERINEQGGYVQDSSGNWKPRNDKRSQYESVGEDPNFKGKFGKKEFKTKDFSKKSWLGGKDYKTTEYAGATDGSRFQKTSQLGQKSARETDADAGLQTDYKTDSYATSAARETGKGIIDRPSDALVDRRRKVFAQPEIVGWQESRKMTVEQSNSILGR